MSDPNCPRCKAQGVKLHRYTLHKNAEPVKGVEFTLVRSESVDVCVCITMPSKCDVGPDVPNGGAA